VKLQEPAYSLIEPMKRFKNIIIKVNEPASPAMDISVLRGVELGRKIGVNIILSDVVEPHETILSTYADIVSPSELIVAQRHDQLVELALKLQGQGLEISARVSQGKNFIETVRAAISNKGDLLIKAANSIKKSFDSNNFHIVRKCPRPVWLIKEGESDKVRKIIAAIDLSMGQHAEGRAQTE
jgi:universal stress protein E